MQLFLEAVIGANPALLDPDALPVPLKVPDLTQKKLCVGIMMHDGIVMPHPPTIQALKWAKEKLEASSEVEVVGYTPYDHNRGYSIVEGGEEMLPLTEWVISPPHVRDHDATQVWKLHDEHGNYRREYSDHWWSQNPEEKSKALVTSTIQLPSYPLWNHFAPIVFCPPMSCLCPPTSAGLITCVLVFRSAYSTSLPWTFAGVGSL
ncbi:uncharacterized protein BJ212DRAFT_1302554 [Suillus subaureus]|uniref:Amidase domain-containing protein n=1 Tax=Suillus subaureus TaxID=48587 RepID=A0A9P7J975_9AGAM|nr:uncharacterized protein BJ212DRAFT_1302554 [Suillus subaureus]KAG1809308.1 hypothetical protein BJ212DRAFT_1302554 [Suillus subaureus]